MKTVDLVSGIRLPISNEEQLLVDKIQNNGGSCSKRSLDIREIYLAAQLVKKDVLTRTKIKDKIYYVLNDVDKIGRI